MTTPRIFLYVLIIFDPESRLRIADVGAAAKYLYLILNFPHRIIRMDMDGQNQAGGKHLLQQVVWSFDN